MIAVAEHNRLMAERKEQGRQAEAAAEALAELAEASATSSACTNNLGAMRSLKLIDYPTPRQVAATPLLFPEGLS